MLSQQLVIIKKLFIRKIELLQRRDELRTTVAKGKEFFYKYAKSGDGRILGDGAQRMIEVITEIENIDSEIKGIDVLIITSLEMEVNQVDFHFNIPQHPNDTGDIIQSIKSRLTSEDIPEDSVLNVDDLWTVILLKEMFDVNNVEIIPKTEGGR
jgi:hypothetical protein